MAGFVIGFFVGGFFGLVIAGLCVASSRDGFEDERAE